MLAGAVCLDVTSAGIAHQETQRVRQAGSMGQQMVRRYDALLGHDRQPGEVFQDGAFQVQFSFVMQLEAGKGDKGLRDGSHLEQMIGRYGFLRFAVCEPEGRDTGSAVTPGQSQRHAWCVHRFHITRDKCIQFVRLRRREQKFLRNESRRPQCQERAPLELILDHSRAA